MLRSDDGRISCGCRFKYIEPVIDFNYESLTNAITKAIEKEASLTGGKFVTAEKETINISQSYDYDALMAEFNALVEKFMKENAESNAPRITQIVERYLGKGKKVSDTTRDQAEFIYLIVSDLKDEIK